MSHASGRWLLEPILGVLTVGNVVMVLLGGAISAQTGEQGRGAVLLAGAALMGLSLIVRRLRPALARWTTIGYALGALGALAATGGFVAIVLFTAVLLATVELGVRGAFAMLGLLLAVLLGFGLLSAPGHVASVLLDTGFAALMLMFAIAVGALIHGLRQAHDEARALLTERDAAHAELLVANARLRQSLELEKDHVLAEERARAARDLHDGLGQQLTALQMSLDYAQRTKDKDPDAAWAEVAVARDGASTALTDMRRWVRALHPVSVAGLSGAEALETIAESFRGTGFEVVVQTTGTSRPLSDAESMYVYRFVQEGLTNALRHGRATRVELTVDIGSGCTIALADNGREEGASTPAGELAEGFGLRSLRERAEALGGTLSAGWARRGLEVRADLPASAPIQPRPAVPA